MQRYGDILPRRNYDRALAKCPRPNFEAPHLKTSLLLPSHFSRLQPPLDLAVNQEIWETDSPSKQIAHFDDVVIERCEDAGVEPL